MGETRRLRPALLTALVVPLIAGCYSFRPTTAAPREVVEADAPRTVRITLADGTVRTMFGPRVVADSIVGTTPAGPARIAAVDVRGLEVERLSPTRTFALVAGQLSAVVSVIALIIAFQPHYSGF